MGNPVKIIHVINRLEAIDRDLVELRTMKRNLVKSRAYYSEMSIAFDRQINTLLNERVKLMELKIENPPENLVNRDWLEEPSSYEPPYIEELKSPEGSGEGRVLSQEEADDVVQRVKDSLPRRKQPVLTVRKSSVAKTAPRQTESDKADKTEDKPGVVKNDQDGLKTYKF